MARRKVEPGDRPRQWGDELAFWRKAAGLSQEELAQIVNMHQTRVSQFELGKALPTMRDVVQFDKALNAGGQLIRSYELVAPYLHDHHPDWFQEYVRSEAKARTIRELQTGHMSGLLQTERYMRALFADGNDTLGPDEVDSLVKGRLERQTRLFAGDNPALLISVLEQATLERRVGNAEVMLEQLQHVLDSMSRRNIIVQVLPFASASRAWFPGMVLLELPKGRHRVYSESLDRGHFIDEVDQVEHWSTDYDRARASALSESESIDLIHGIMRGLSNDVPSDRSEWRPMVQEQLLRAKRRQLRRGGPRLPPRRPRP
ncbi:helix-turn-helix domain-containing protein [Kitasatospora sp. NPDC057541]|uniref:helix-turn-helix domain-containing protein n=1 Tax=unclassified Kitasatospora TaxID=2633591 RepID=UPI0036CCEE02